MGGSKRFVITEFDCSLKKNRGRILSQSMYEIGPSLALLCVIIFEFRYVSSFVLFLNKKYVFSNSNGKYQSTHMALTFINS